MAKPKHAVIYIFGLGDRRARGQTLAVKLWRLYGVSPEVFHVYWTVPEPFEQKLGKLLARIDELTGQGYAVSLVSASAGASVAVAAYAARPEAVRAVTCICGKLRNPGSVSSHTYQSNPAFQGAMDQLEANLDALDAQQRSRILSIRPTADNLVAPADTIIPGAQNKQIATMGHAFSIGYCVTIYAPCILRFIKRTVSST